MAMKASRKLSVHHKGYFFILPYFVMFFIFGLYPILSTLWMSFTENDGWGSIFIGIENYERLITDEVFYKSVKNTWFMWMLNFVPQISSALFLSWVYTYSNIKGVSFFRAVFYFPNLVTATSLAVLFSMFLDTDSGILNQVLLGLGLIDENINFLSKPLITQLTISSVQWWMWFGHSTIIILAGMTAIPKDYFEAAKVDGATSHQIFWNIILPLLKPTMIYIFITSLIGGMQLFDLPALLTKPMGSPQDAMVTMVVYLYQTAFTVQNYGYGAAIAWGIFAIILFTSLSLWLMFQHQSVWIKRTAIIWIILLFAALIFIKTVMAVTMILIGFLITISIMLVRYQFSYIREGEVK